MCRVAPVVLLLAATAATAAMPLKLYGMGNCPFCPSPGERLLDKVTNAPVVLYGTLQNARLTNGGTLGAAAGTTDMVVKKVVKESAALKLRPGTLTLPAYYPDIAEKPTDYLVFADVVRQQLQPFLAMQDSKDLMEYLSGVLKLPANDPARRLPYFYKFINHPDDTIARDAYNEFAFASYKEVAAAAKHFKPDEVAGWLRSRDTQTYKIGLFGLMLGLCGRPGDAATLRKLIEDPDARPFIGVDGLLGGYCLLEPVKGPQLALEIINRPKEDFNYRYAAIRTVSFLLTEVKGTDRAALFRGVRQALGDKEIADLLVDELRKGAMWAYTPDVIKLLEDPRSPPLARKAAVRFALMCPKPEAKAAVEKVRKQDRVIVEIEEEAIKIEQIGKQKETPPQQRQ